MKRPVLSHQMAWLLGATVTFLRLWLTASQRIAAIGPSPHDDSHFLTQASYLIAGQWLGPYDNLTLIKGPFFPAWIAFAYALGIPLLLSAQILYAASCGILTSAVRPLLPRRALALTLYAVLVFNPMSAATGTTRVLREMITPALTVLTWACATGLLLTVRVDGRRAPWWSVGLGISFAALWLTREEQLATVVPTLLFAFGCAVVLAWQQGPDRAMWRRLWPWLGALGIWAAIVCTVAGVNLVRYGLFDKTEFDAGSFKAAYGALSRVKPREFKPLVPVANETRRRIYRVSPAAQELRPYLEGRIGSMWEIISEYQQDASNGHEILGGWFMWALRDAVQAAGYYDDGTYPERYYTRLAQEVNAACENGLLDCYGPRTTMLPAWHNQYIRLWIPSFVGKMEEVVGFRAVDLEPISSIGTPEQLALFTKLAGGTTPGPRQEGSPDPVGALPPREIRLSAMRRAGLEAVLRSYQLLNPIFFAAALLAYSFITLRLIRKREGINLWIVLTGCALLSASRIALISYMNIASLRIAPGKYLSEAYPGMLAFVALACLASLSRVLEPKKR